MPCHLHHHKLITCSVTIISKRVRVSTQLHARLVTRENAHALQGPAINFDILVLGVFHSLGLYFELPQCGRTACWYSRVTPSEFVRASSPNRVQSARCVKLSNTRELVRAFFIYGRAAATRAAKCREERRTKAAKIHPKGQLWSAWHVRNSRAGSGCTIITLIHISPLL